jgi:small GTP-binding protein
MNKHDKYEGKYEGKYDIIIIGNEKVGKSTILERYIKNIFNPERKPTYAVDFWEKDYEFNNKTYNIKLWDTAGQEKYAKLTKSYYKKAQGIVVTCSLDNKNSYYDLTDWLNSIKDNTSNDIDIVIIGNKSDLVDFRVVKTVELEELSLKKGYKYFETSAKTGFNILEAFGYLIERIILKGSSKRQGLSLYNRLSLSKSICCKAN